MSESQSRVDWLAFECKHAEDAFVDFSQRLAADEAIESLEAEGEFREGEGSLPPEAAVRRRTRFCSSVYSGP